MLITKDTKIFSLTEQYPFLIERLAAHNSNFKKLKTPLLRQTLGRVASIEKAAALGNEPVLGLLLFIAGEIMAVTGEAVEISPPAVQKQTDLSGGLSREQRLAQLREIILELHNGAELSQLQEKFNRTVGDIAPEEIAALEQTLVSEGLPETEIKKMCHLHAALFQDALAGQEMPPVPAGHPVDTYLKENARVRELLAAIDRELSAVRAAGAAAQPAALSALKDVVLELADIQTHYVRKENQLFPLLELHDLSAPGKVMWEVHDDIRGKFRQAQKALAVGNVEESDVAVRDLAAEVAEMINKEEKILFPMCLETLTAQDWSKCRRGDDEIGYSFGVVPGNDWVAEALTEPSANAAGLISLSTGRLAPETIDAILRNLPVDISFVGSDDKVAYYSDVAHRIFPRSAAVIGREVKNCHPSKSVHVVMEILDAFKKGERNKAEFWLELGEKFIHIQYLALHNAHEEYLGCLEVSQDATQLRALAGQRRLLEWE